MRNLFSVRCRSLAPQSRIGAMRSSGRPANGQVAACKRSSPRRATVVVACVLLALAADLSAQPESEVSSRGFKADKVYSVTDLDSVNLLNGNLTISIPLGITYPISESFSYGFHLVYNSYAWEYRSIQLSDGQYYLSGEPSPLSNAGLGWSVSLGRLIPPGTIPINITSKFMYVSPDGSRHKFYDVLHSGDPPEVGVFYSRDNSYLRLKEVSSTEVTVEHGDGAVHTFTDHGASGWLLDSIHDQYVDANGDPVNVLSIAYSPDLWTITDSQGRIHKVYLQTFSGDLATPQIDSIELEGFGGSAAGFRFQYEDQVLIDRGCRDNVPTGSGPPESVTVPLLQQLSLPSGERYTIPDSGGIAYTNSCDNDSASGTLTRLVLPTLGEIAWTYQPYFMGGECATGPQNPNPPFAVSPSGVATRTLIKKDGSPHGVWTYDNAVEPSPPWQCNVPPNPDVVPRISKTVVVRPDGSCTKSFFDTEALTTNFGLPVHPDIEWAGVPGLNLSSETWADFTDAGPGTPQRELRFDCSGEHLRSTYLDHETDGAGGLEVEVNRRVKESRTRFEDDLDGASPRYSKIVKLDFDGLGHYRVRHVRRDWDGPRKTLTTEFPDRGTPGQSDWDMSATEPWVLNTYSLDEVYFEGLSSVQRACFSPEGRLQRRRMLKNNGNSAGSTDFLAVFEYEDGNRVLESYYGGDRDGFDLLIGNSSGLLCAKPPPTRAPQYVIAHEYEHGSRSRSYYVKANGSPMEFNSLELDIDAFTGLPEASYDVSGIRTDLSYDDLGRLILASPEPGHGAETEYKYLPAAGGFARVEVSQQGGGNLLARTDYEYDGFGRLVQESRRMPGAGAFARRSTSYNALGWTLSQSAWGLGAPSPKVTLFSDHDTFGRPATITSPDGRDTTFSYVGAREVTRTSQVYRGGFVAYWAAVTREEYDILGNLERITEQAGKVDAQHTTTERTMSYTYDEMDRLSRAAGEDYQVREWNYDGRGMLTWQDIAEASRKVHYPEIDARGNARITGAITAVIPPPTYTYGRTVVYDRAERVSEVYELDGQARLLNKFLYGTSNSGQGTNKRLGKMYSSTRYNYLDGAPDIAVEQVFHYKGLGGRVSKRRTKIGTNGATPTQRFVVNFTWNDLGQPASLSYPSCSGCGGAGAPARVLDYDYEMGWLREIPNQVTNITYHPSGTLASAQHSNGVSDIWDVDPSAMPRPRRIRTSGASVEFDTGIYYYDGEGNIESIGSDYFRYDPVSRLVHATLQQGTIVQQYEYDEFGNILNERTNGVDREFYIDPWSNRIVGGNYSKNGHYLLWGSAGEKNELTYDKLDALIQAAPVDEPRLYAHRFLYDSDNERVARITGVHPDTEDTQWTVRDLNGKMIRTFEHADSDWQWKKDFIYRGNHLNSQRGSSQFGNPGLEHVHVDHLGTVRAVTNSAAQMEVNYAYYPYGAPIGLTPTQAPAFTGHERNATDADEPTGAGLDYMHARYYAADLVRFTQRDLIESGDPARPQSWNRFAYAQGNPLKFVDPDGRVSVRASKWNGQLQYTVAFQTSKLELFLFKQEKWIKAFTRGNAISRFGNSLEAMNDEFKGQEAFSHDGDFDLIRGDLMFEKAFSDLVSVPNGSSLLPSGLKALQVEINAAIDDLADSGEISRPQQVRLKNRYDLQRLAERSRKDLERKEQRRKRLALENLKQ